MSPNAQTDQELDELIDVALEAPVDDVEEGQGTAIDGQARAAVLIALPIVIVTRAFRRDEELDQSVL